MEWTRRTVDIFFNINGDVYIIPPPGYPQGEGKSDPWFITHITDEGTVYENLKTAYETPSEDVEALPDPTPIEIITRTKNWERATRDLGLLLFVWSKDEGGFVILLMDRMGGAFCSYKTIKLGETIDDATFKPVIMENLKAELARHIKKMEKKENKKLKKRKQ